MSWVGSRSEVSADGSAGGSDALPVPLDGTPLYVHLPYCAAKCHYCDFFSVPADGQDIDATLTAILTEARQRAPRHPRTVFLGGGTPSLLSRVQLTRVLNGLDDITGFRSSAVEVTAECNPESLDEDKASCLLELGVNRLSIGFQSLHDQVLQLLGRVHTVADSFAAYAAARRAGVRNVNIDVIYALPNQDLEQWNVDLERVLELAPDHVSAYNLTFEDDTLFRRWLEQGRLKKLPDELELAFFEHTRRRLCAAGLAPYEISNYARSGAPCVHNVNYWRNGDYLGIGPSAVSKVGTLRAGNARSISEYRRCISRDGSAAAWRERPPDAVRHAETWWLGLRLGEGLAARDAWSRAGMPGPWSPAKDPMVPIAERLVAMGMLERLEDRWMLTARGLPVADAIAREFMDVSEPLAVDRTAESPR